MIYERSSAIAVSEKIALTAAGLANANKPGRIEIMVDNQIARIGVLVKSSMWSKNPRSGNPLSLENAYTVLEHAWRAVWTTKNAVKQTKV